jgi:ATP-dependent DNA ligase
MTAGGWSPTRTAPPSGSSAAQARTTAGASRSSQRRSGALPSEKLILDGEVAIFDDRLISRFEWFRKRPEDVASTFPIYMAFDCLYLERRDLRPLPLRERRGELEQVVENDHALIFPARRLDPNGLVAWRQVRERG